MPFIAPVLAVAGTVAGAAGSIASGDASASAAEYQSEIAQRNAQIAGFQAGSAEEAGHEQTAETSLAGAQQLGRFKAEQGASGIDVNTGSSVTARGSLREINLLRAQNTEYNAERSAWGYRMQGLNFADQSQVYSAESKSDREAGVIGAAGKVIGGLGGLAGSAFGGGAGGSGGGTGIFGSASPIAGGGSLTSAFNWGDIPDDEFDNSQDTPLGQGGIGHM
jgi:hypothetical protein